MIADYLLGEQGGTVARADGHMAHLQSDSAN
jgi:hypothetical protein